jgi:hypothetical protein
MRFILVLFLLSCVSTMKMDRERLYTLPEQVTPKGFRVSFDRTKVNLDAVDYTAISFIACIKRNTGMDLDLDVLKQYKIIFIPVPFDSRSDCPDDYCNGQTSRHPISFIILSKEASKATWSDWFKHELSHVYKLQTSNHSKILVKGAGRCFIN